MREPSPGWMSRWLATLIGDQASLTMAITTSIVHRLDLMGTGMMSFVTKINNMFVKKMQDPEQKLDTYAFIMSLLPDI